MLKLKSLFKKIAKKTIRRLDMALNPNYTDKFSVKHFYFSDNLGVREVLFKDGKIIAKNETNYL